MVIGILQFEVIVPWSQSLKDKRRVVRSLKDRLHREHQVSVAEVGALDQHRVALLGLAVVGTDARRAGAVMDRVLAKVRALHDASLGSVSRDILHASALEWRGGADADPGAGDAPVWTDAELRDAERLVADAGAEEPR
ncbi:MAG TPA: hypothetical protein DEB06_10910 [Phycisphaerales bacterium]|nr:hypothetical protein [Phycisphaerales bacterium]